MSEDPAKIGTNQMSVIELKGLSTAEAEITVARIWRVLEKHDLASPLVATESHANDDVSILLTFRSQDDAKLVAETLRKLSITGSSEG